MQTNTQASLKPWSAPVIIDVSEAASVEAAKMSQGAEHVGVVTIGPGFPPVTVAYGPTS